MRNTCIVSSQRRRNCNLSIPTNNALLDVFKMPHRNLAIEYVRRMYVVARGIVCGRS